MLSLFPPFFCIDLFLVTWLLKHTVNLILSWNLAEEIAITLKQKLELPITEKFEKGESLKKLANDYGIGVQTVRNIKINKEKLKNSLEIVNLTTGREN